MHLLLTVQFCIHQCYCRVSPENKHNLPTYLHKCKRKERKYDLDYRPRKIILLISVRERKGNMTRNTAPEELSC